MARRAARTQPINTSLPKGRKSTQLERLLNGMITAANRDGYAGANVSATIAQAGVSRPTFYDYFADRDACFLAAIADTNERLQARIRKAVGDRPPEHAEGEAIAAIVQFASEEPARAHFLMSESMTGGPAALDARDHGLLEIERTIEAAHRKVAPTTPIADICPRILAGGIYRLLAVRLRRGEPSLSRLLEDLLAWSAAYEQPAGETRWRTLTPGAAPAPSPFLPKDAPPVPKPLPPGRPGISEAEVAANHRQRILYAAAQLAGEKGYNATTIADITRRAGVDGRGFYALFLDKQDAFMTVHELGLQQVMNVTAQAFFAGERWPERIWEAARAFTQFLEGNPPIAHVGFVEAHAVGPGASQRIQDSYSAFAIFLQEGYLHLSDRPPPTPAALEAIVATIFEIVYHQSRADSKPRISGLTGHICFLCLAPFLGAGDADEFIASKGAAGARTRSRRSPAAAKSAPAPGR